MIRTRPGLPTLAGTPVAVIGFDSTHEFCEGAFGSFTNWHALDAGHSLVVLLQPKPVAGFLIVVQVAFFYLANHREQFSYGLVEKCYSDDDNDDERRVMLVQQVYS